MGAALLAPVLVGVFQLPVMQVHLFMLYFACLSAITPPVAVANFAAGAIAGVNAMALGPYAVKLAIGGFILPFLEDHYTCYPMSTRGRGLSSDNADHSLERLIDDAQAFAESIGEPVGLVATSGGAISALGGAARSTAGAARIRYSTPFCGLRFATDPTTGTS
jgi:hypothetical protein